jgi:hypothetical protein
VTVPSSFTQFFVFVIEVRNLTDSCCAFAQQPSHLTRRESDKCVSRFVGHDLSYRTGALCHLTTLTGGYFNIVNLRTCWESTERAGVACGCRNIFTTLNDITNLYAVRCNDVALHSVFE